MQFQRADALAYISHLDAHRAYNRMFRRAGLSLKMSQGFNPHPILSLAIPLPLGFRSDADYIDVTLSEQMPVQEVSERLSVVTGSEHLILQGLARVDLRAPALAALISWGRYEISLADEELDLSELCLAFLNENVHPFVKETKRGSREINARSLVRELSFAEGVVKALLCLGQPAVFRPEELLIVLGELGQLSLTPQLIKRKDIYIESDRLLTPLEWAALESESTG
jgi:radical SAM-linked protein